MLQHMVSVVILSHKRMDVAWLCAQSACMMQDDVVKEVLLVDNSIRGDLMLRDFMHVDKCVNIVRVPHEISLHYEVSALGISSGRNYGAKKCSGKYLLFIDDDAFLLPHALSPMVEIMEKNESVGIVTGVGLDAVTPSVVQYAGIGVTRTGYSVPYYTGTEVTSIDINAVQEVQVAAGGFFLVRRSLFEQLDGFDVIHDPVGYEDHDFSYKARSTGYSIILSMKAWQIHWGNLSINYYESNEKRHAHMNNGWVEFKRQWKDMFQKENGPSHDDASKQRNESRVLMKARESHTTDVFDHMYSLWGHYYSKN